MSEKDLQEITKTYEGFLYKSTFETEKKRFIKSGWIFISSEEKDGKITAIYKASPEAQKKQKRQENINVFLFVALVVFIFFVGCQGNEDTETPDKDAVQDETVFQEDAEERLKYRLFSAWDGSHRGLVKLTKALMNDPDSFQHDDTTFFIERNPDGTPKSIVVNMLYRGKNAFGGVVRGFIKARSDLEGNIIEVLEQQ